MKDKVVSGAVLQLDSAIGAFVFIVFGPKADGLVDPQYGRRIEGMWVMHFEKSLEQTEGWMWESLLASSAWVNIAESFNAQSASPP